MRRRLLLVFAVMGAVAIAGFAVPLALVASDARTRELVLERESDVQRFAVLADEYVRSGDAGAIGPEVDAYYAVYGEPVLVVSTRGVPDYSAGMHVDAQVEAAIERGLRNERGSGVERLTPFSPDTELFVRPVGTGAQVNGVVVIEASTAAVQRDVARSWAMIAAGLVAALAAFAALALALSRWVLRPLSNLSDAMSDLAARLPAVPAASARHDEDVPPHPSVAGGPPEIRRLAETFDGLFATVLRSVAAQRRLVADASHQLRNPLAALQLRLDTIEPDIPDSAATDFRFATDEAQRLHEILRGPVGPRRGRDTGPNRDAGR